MSGNDSTDVSAGTEAGSRGASRKETLGLEVERLNAQWLELSGELTQLEQDNHELRQALEQKDRDAAAAAGRIGALETELADRKREIAALTAQIKGGDVDQALADRNQSLSAANDGLRAQLTELESYLDGRKAHWDEMQARLTEYRNSLSGMEIVIRGHETEKSNLGSRILELERRNAQVEGRMAEKDHAYEKLRQELKAEVDAHEKLRQESARLGTEAGSARNEVERHEALTDSLKRGIARRDNTIERLETELKKEREVIASADEARRKLTERTTRLEESLDERVEAIQSLRNEISRMRRKLRTLEAGKDSAAPPAEDESFMVDEHNQNETAEAAEQRADELARLVESLRKENERLEAENSANSELIAQLETDLEARGHRLGVVDQDDDDADDDELSMLSHQLRMIDRTGPEAGANGSASSAQLIDPSVLFGASRATARMRRRMLPVNGTRGREFELSKERMTIGRSSASDICIRDTSISRLHALITESPNGLVIEDSGSTNGVRINDERVERAVLHDGDIVSLGTRCVYRYVEG